MNLLMISIIPIISIYLVAYDIARDDFNDCIKDIRNEVDSIFLGLNLLHMPKNHNNNNVVTYSSM